MDDAQTAQKEKLLTEDEIEKLASQNTRLVPEHKAKQLEIDAQRHWDLFYKRNETKFFKDRHWTTREFKALLDDCTPESISKSVLEVGCGVGNLVFPLIEEGLNFQFYACDFSPRAVDYVRSHKLYDENYIKAFQADLTSDDFYENCICKQVDVVTMVFVLSAIHPEKFIKALGNVFKVLKPGGALLFRDYGLYDMAQIRFKAGNKIAENFYMRQDGTRSYYFSLECIEELLHKAGFKIIENVYVHRRTINIKENINVPRIFVQCKAEKPG